MTIDTNFKFYTDSNGGDPDLKSPTLRRYHRMLWSKELPDGTRFELADGGSRSYLSHSSPLGEFVLGSDAITHSYRGHKRKKCLIAQVKEEADDLFEIGSNIGGYLIFPKNKIDGKFTINQARGVDSFIDDRFDLTLECIRLFYLGQTSPLYETLLRYENFFGLFQTFQRYVEFFLLDDLVDIDGNVKFYLPFDGFKTKPSFSSPEDYLVYKERVSNFVKLRNQRILGLSLFSK